MGTSNSGASSPRIHLKSQESMALCCDNTLSEIWMWLSYCNPYKCLHFLLDLMLEHSIQLYGIPHSHHGIYVGFLCMIIGLYFEQNCSSYSCMGLYKHARVSARYSCRSRCGRTVCVPIFIPANLSSISLEFGQVSTAQYPSCLFSIPIHGGAHRGCPFIYLVIFPSQQNLKSFI